MLRKQQRSAIRMSDFITKPNLVPLIDVCLTLVIIFMVMAPLIMQAGIKIMESPTGASTGKHAAGENIEVVLTADNKILLNGREVNWQNFPAQVHLEIIKSKDKLVFITADDQNQVGQVVKILDISKQQGAKKLAILKKPDKSDDKKVNAVGGV